MANKDIKKVLTLALEMEKAGHKFYSEVSEKAANDITKNMFRFLADNEMLHIEKIKEFCDSISDVGKFPDLGLEGISQKRDDEIHLFFTRLSELTDKIKDHDSDVKACEFAMELENKGSRFYHDMLDVSHDEELSKLLNFLIEEEKKHYEGIESIYTYLTDSDNWYMYEEGSFPQG